MGNNDYYKSLFKENMESNKLFNCKFINDEEDRIGVCKALRDSKTSRYLGDAMPEYHFKNKFLGSICNLDFNSQAFYKNHIDKIAVVKTHELNNGEGLLLGNPIKQTLFLTRRPLHTIDYVEFSHELGHLPQMLKPHSNEYYEYIEALPMFFEYLACKQVDEENAFDIFLKIRLQMAKDAAREYLSYQKMIKGNNSYRDRCLELEQKEAYKYLKSLELAIELIKIYEKDNKDVTMELSKYIESEKSMKKIAKTLGISTTGCPNLMSLTRK